MAVETFARLATFPGAMKQIVAERVTSSFLNILILLKIPVAVKKRVWITALCCTVPKIMDEWIGF
jgi:hypothetical protein